MPASGRGHMHYTTATKEVNHGAPVVEDGIAGLAVKQQTRSWKDGLANQAVIDVDEDFGIEYGGVFYVDHTAAISGSGKGDTLYIDPDDNTLQVSTTGNVAFGKIKDLPGERGCPLGKYRVDQSLV